MQQTKQNLDSAFYGEAGAHVKYRWFAKLCRDQGYDEVADHFEWTADQELKHAWGHLELIHNQQLPSAYDCLTMAIAGETYEYTEMYPKMLADAMLENNQDEVDELENQIQESQEHAEQFQDMLYKQTLELAERRFRALKSVEQRHAEKYTTLRENM